MKRLAGVWLAAFVACQAGSAKQFVRLAETTELRAGAWRELTAPEPLRTPAYHHQVCLRPAAPARLAADPMGVVDAAGRAVELRVLASDGDDELPLRLSSYQGDRVCFGVSDAALDRAFSRVRLRASSTLRVERVEWQSTDK